MVDYRQVYYLHDASLRSALHVRPRLDIPDPFSLARGQARFEHPIVFDRDTGTKPVDLIGTTHAVLYLVSNKLTEALTQNRVTGWRTFPVEVNDRAGQRIEGYQGFAVAGRCGALDNRLSKVMWRENPLGARYKVWVGLYFPPDTWDGSDIFCPEDTAHVFVVQRVKDILESIRASNIEFIPLTEMERLML